MFDSLSSNKCVQLCDHHPYPYLLLLYNEPLSSIPVPVNH